MILSLIYEKYPLEIYRQASNESLILDNFVFDFAPRENKETKSILLDENCEELAFPSLFPNNNFEYSWKRQTKLSGPKYINQRLLNYTQRFASNINCLFFCQTVLQLKSLQEQISIAIRKHSSPLNASMFRNYKELTQNIARSDQAFYFMNPLKDYQLIEKKIQLAVLAMIKQLLYAGFFLTLSCADLHWEEIPKIIAT